MKNIDDILKENTSKPEPYKVPEGYFEDFDARLNAKIDAIEAEKVASGEQEESTPAPKSRGERIWLTLKPIVYVAAAIVVLYAATYIIVQPKINRAVNESVAKADRNQVNKAIQEYENMYEYLAEEDDMDDDEDEEMYDLLTYND